MNALQLIRAATEPVTGGHLNISFTKLREMLLEHPTSATIQGTRYTMEAIGDEHVQLGPAIQITHPGHKGTCVFCAHGKITIWDFQDDEIHDLDVPHSASPPVLLQHVLRFVAGPKPWNTVHAAAESETQADKTKKVIEALEQIPFRHGKLHKIAPYLFVNVGSISFTSSYAAPKLNNVDVKLLFEISSDADTSSAPTRQYFEVFAHIAWSMESGELYLRRICAEHECGSPLQHYDVCVTGLNPEAVVNKLTVLASKYVIENARHIFNNLAPNRRDFDLARAHYANKATAAVEPAKAHAVHNAYDELRRMLPKTTPDKRVREYKPIRVNGLDVVVLSHESDDTIRFHILDVDRDTCGFAETTSRLVKNTWVASVEAELQGASARLSTHSITEARDSRDLLRQLLVWFTNQYKAHQEQLKNFKARPTR